MRFKAKCECGTEFRAAKRKTFGTNIRIHEVMTGNYPTTK